MKKAITAPKSRVSAYMRELWAAEAEHPVFAGSAKKFHPSMLMENPKPKRAASGSKKPRRVARA